MKFRILYFNVKNVNGRIYREENFDLDLINEKALEIPLYGEIDMPSAVVVSHNKISHIIKKIKKDDLGLIADVKILNTIAGKKIRDLLKVNKSLVLRTRGTGDVDADGYIKNYTFITCDFIIKSRDAFSTSEIKRIVMNKKLKKIKTI